MSIFNLFKRKKEKAAYNRVLQANATLYPDKILIDTTDMVKEGFGISSTNVTILPIDTDIAVIGSTVRHHLSLTRTGLSIPKDYNQHYKEFLKNAGFKNGKEHHRNALYLSISLHDNEIKIRPTRNGGYTGKDRGFYDIEGANVIVNEAVDNATLGDKIKYGWTKCE